MTDTTTATLSEFLSARLDEDEAVERAELALRGSGTVHPLGHPLDPARVLATVEAHRRIVADHEDERQRRDVYNRGYDAGELTTANDLRFRLDANVRCAALEATLRALAAIYADHAEFRPEWAHA